MPAVVTLQITSSASATVHSPQGITFSGKDLYFAEPGSNAFLGVPAAGGQLYTLVQNKPQPSFILSIPGGGYYYSTIAGGDVWGVTNNATQYTGFTSPAGLAVDPTYVYVAEAGKISVFTPGAIAHGQYCGGLGSPKGLARDNLGNLYVGDGTSIYKVTPDPKAGDLPTGTLVPFASGFNSVFGLAMDPGGNILATDHGANVLYRLTPTGVVSVVATALAGPTGVTVDPGTGAIYVANDGNHTICKVQ
jgi:DNA-binding beta-propeller fold protein YncE